LTFPFAHLDFAKFIATLRNCPLFTRLFFKEWSLSQPIPNFSTPPREKQQKRNNTKKRRYNRIKIAFPFSCVVDLQHFHTNHAHQNNTKKSYSIFDEKKHLPKNIKKVKRYDFVIF
jgi:hypothetical protein